MDRLLECPYNRSHQIRPERMQYHLIKCRKQFPEKNLVICPFNATHHMAKSEERNHMINCPDRRIVDIQRYRFNEPTPGHHGDLSNPLFYGSSKIPKEAPGPDAPAQAAAAVRPRTRSKTRLITNETTSVMDTTSVSSIGKDYLKKAGRVDFLKDYLVENQKPGFGTGQHPTKQSKATSGLDDMSSLGSSLALAEARSGRRRGSSSERKPLRRPRSAAAGDPDTTSAGSGVRPVTPTSANFYISDRG